MVQRATDESGGSLDSEFVIWIQKLQVGTCEALRFDSYRPIRFESRGSICKFLNWSRLPIARRSQTTQTINGA